MKGLKFWWKQLFANINGDMNAGRMVLSEHV